MHLLDRPHVVLIMNAHGQRVGGEHPVIERSHGHTDVAGIFLGRRLGIQFENPALGAVGTGDHQLFLARQDVMRGEHFEVEPGVDQHHHGCTVVECTAVIHMGAVQVVVVTGRAAEVRDIPQCCAECGKHHLLAAGQAIEQRECKAVALDWRQGIAAAGADQPLDHLLRVDQAEALHLIDQRGGDRKVPVIEAHRRHAIAAVAQRGDFTGAGAADQAYATKVLFQCFAQSLQVVFGGAEEQHEPQVRVQQLPRQVLSGQPCVGSLRHGTDHTVVMSLLHRGLRHGVAE
ncbi:hypothetical protein D3C79_734390 [compost metagenome]